MGGRTAATWGGGGEQQRGAEEGSGGEEEMGALEGWRGRGGKDKLSARETAGRWGSAEEGKAKVGWGGGRRGGGGGERGGAGEG